MSLNISGVGGSAAPGPVRTNLSSWMLDQPVYCTSAISSHFGLSLRIERQVGDRRQLDIGGHAAARELRC